MAADTDILTTFIDDLNTVLEDGSTGVNAQMEAGWEQVNKIDSVFDVTQLEAKYAPQLLAMHVNAQLEESTSGKRDWIHTVAFIYKNTKNDRRARRVAAARTAEALLATINPFPGQVSDRFPNAKVIDIREPEAFIGWERNVEKKDEYLLATVQFVQRQELQ